MNAVVKTNSSVKDFFARDIVKAKLQELVGKNAASFTTSVLQIVNSNSMLVNADPASIFNAACMAATLNLPINNNLGFAYIVPFKNNKENRTDAQFQLGYKGFIQLAQRSGQFERIAATPVYQGQLLEANPLLGYVWDWSVPANGEPIGYVAFFKLINGFTAELYMTKTEVMAHAGKYSQTYKKGFGVWKDQFEAMALKTVLKLLLSKQAPLSIEMQQAQLADQSIVKDVDAQEFEYIDHQADEVQVTQIDLTNNPTEFDRLSNAIAMGDLEKMKVLSGERYIISDEQRSVIAGM